LSTSEVGKQIAKHHGHTAGEHAKGDHAARDRVVSIVEAVLLSIVALLATGLSANLLVVGTRKRRRSRRAATAVTAFRRESSCPLRSLAPGRY
jgi:hypothetical protein